MHWVKGVYGMEMIDTNTVHITHYYYYTDMLILWKIDAFLG